METLISDLKKVMNSEIEDKDKYMKMLINGFLRERDTELLTIQGVVKSLNVKETISFEDWLKASNYKIKNDEYIRNGITFSFSKINKKYNDYLKSI